MMELGDLPRGIQVCVLKNVAHACAVSSMRMAAACFRREPVTASCGVFAEMQLLGVPVSGGVGIAFSGCRAACDRVVAAYARKDVRGIREAQEVRQLARTRLFDALEQVTLA